MTELDLSRTSLVSVQARLRRQWNQPELLLQAITHLSYIHDHKLQASASYERLEFLGDAILGLVLAEQLMTLFPSADEGELSKRRAYVVSTASLASMLEREGIAAFIRVGNGYAHERGRERLLASVFEAIVGSIYLDAGFESARDWILQRVGGSVALRLEEDAKSRLQEWCQSRFQTTPRYEVVASEGPDHERTFTVEVVIPDGRSARGRGASRKAAEQGAAQVIWKEVSP
jgi:ribonuclease III